ncbi:hypothetical protein NKI12_28680 [Mesorhizobium australicum]|uniref:Uncharacterized protein n=1 Tax=Mesorhizobium australicum TaxID=536018 RepID=A0ACC6T7A7_9HYPH
MAIIFESLQFVAFTTRQSQKTAVQMWQDAFGELPENFQQHPMGGSQASSTLGDVNRIIIVQPNRIDFLVQAAPAGPNKPGAIENPNAAIADGRDLLKKLVAGEAVQRPAVVFQTWEEFPDSKSSISRTADQIPGLRPPNGAVDLNFQANVPRPSLTFPEISIQRLYRVANGRRVLVQLEIGPGQNVMQQQSDGSYVATQYVDVFASPETPTDRAQFDVVLDEIVKEAQLILSKGYDHFT